VFWVPLLAVGPERASDLDVEAEAFVCEVLLPELPQAASKSVALSRSIAATDAALARLLCVRSI